MKVYTLSEARQTLKDVVNRSGELDAKGTSHRGDVGEWEAKGKTPSFLYESILAQGERDNPLRART